MIETIYVEEAIKNHPRTKFILKKFKNSRIISIDKYGEIFNKRNQNFRIQKANPCLILAKKKDNFVLPAPKGFGIGSSKNFYFSHMYNCIYDCRYCFLQGMYSSANYVIFVNFEDFDIAIKKTIEKSVNLKLTFFSGYDCDSLAFENVTGFAKHILSIFRTYSQAEIEFRTKSVQKEPFLSMKPIQNVILAYSLMPELMSKALDNKAPLISKRIGVISQLASRGWKIGLRFDPLIHGKNWKKLYKDLLENIFNNISLDCLHSVTFGSLRFPKRMYKDILMLHPNEPLFASPLSLNNKMISYDIEIDEEMTSYCKNLSLKYINENQIFKCSI